VRVNILIVEDNRHMRRMLAEMVRTAFDPIPVLEAADGNIALALCRDSRPELVLMDVGLPDSSGIDLTVQIKAMLPESKVVIVSNHRTRASQDAARAAGAAAYVFKDEVYEKLLTTLTKVLTPL
jgi:two-component system, NarL family, response regulator LiaR